MGKFIASIFGGGEKKVDTAPIVDTEAEKAKANKGRAALYQTAGGAAGQELSPDQVAKRPTLMGN